MKPCPYPYLECYISHLSLHKSPQNLVFDAWTTGWPVQVLPSLGQGIRVPATPTTLTHSLPRVYNGTYISGIHPLLPQSTELTHRSCVSLSVAALSALSLATRHASFPRTYTDHVLINPSVALLQQWTHNSSNNRPACHAKPAAGFRSTRRRHKSHKRSMSVGLVSDTGCPRYDMVVINIDQFGSKIRDAVDH